MARVIQPSRDGLQKAWALGRRMAMSEPLLRPMLGDAGTFTQYEEFRLVHRSQMESRPDFAAWDEQLNRLAEREARHVGLKTQSATGLDLFIVRLVVPMKRAFWIGWESARGLERLFVEARRRSSTAAAEGGPVKVFRASQLSERVQKPEVSGAGDEGFWVSITGEGKEVRDKNRPQVLAATTLLKVAAEKEKAPEPEMDEFSLVGMEVEEISASAVIPGEAREKRAPAMLSDDDVPDPYASDE